jgi:endogenous inhibitor of DNA gyrase (YacG/DUF329 family)
MKTVRCPICKKEVPLTAPEMPFCSERCRLIDLGKWSDEEYRIPSAPAQPAPPSPEDEDDE